MIEPDSSTFIGIDLKSGKRCYTYAALDGSAKLAAIGQGRLDDVFSFIGGCHSALCAVSAPLTPCPETGPHPDFLQSPLFPIGPQRRTEKNQRKAEHDLWQRGITITNAPTKAGITKAPTWIRRGFQFGELLEETGFRVWPSEDAPKQYIEVEAEAAFWHWLGNRPAPETSLEGRLQRQLILAEMDLDVPDPMVFFEEVTRYKLLKGQLTMDGIYSLAELNALICALTALLLVKSPAKVASFGSKEEGLIFLPIH